MDKTNIDKKAEDIFLGFYTVELQDMTHLDKEVAKECSLIMVNEIIQITRSSFWYRVKEVIEQM